MIFNSNCSTDYVDF
jgi:hypothetical protein